MDYSTLQAKLKEYKEQGLTAIRLNAPAGELQTELERIEATQHEDGLAGDSTGNYLAVAPAIYTEWTPFLQIGDVVKVPFQQTVTITGREEKEHWIEYCTDAQFGNDEVFRVTYKTQYLEIVEETPESIAQEYVHSLYEGMNVSLSQIQVKLVSIEEENTVITFRVYDSEWTTLQVPRMMWDNFVMNRSQSVFEQDLEQECSFNTAEGQLRDAIAQFPEISHGQIKPLLDGASATLFYGMEFSHSVNGLGDEWYVNANYKRQYPSALEAVKAVWAEWQNEKAFAQKLADDFSQDDYWEQHNNRKALIFG